MENIRDHMLFIALLFLLGACSSDTISVPPVQVREGTCSDGIRNGEEVIIDCGGECPGFCPPASIGVLEGEIVANLQLNPTIAYRLTGGLLVRDGSRLSIPAGTTIKADPDVGAYIAIAQGGQLLVSGQPENPVIITSGAENPAPGDWGGIIVCGQAPIVSGEVGRTDIIDIFYGGSDIENSSGGINYLRIEYAGAVDDNGKKFDGISFYGVGAFTNITNLQTFGSLGNGIRFIGGNADAKQLVVTESGANSVVVQDDWSGNGKSWYLSGVSAESGIQISADETIDPVLPIVSDTITNVTILGPMQKGGVHYSDGGGKYTLVNIFTSNIGLGINVEGSTASEQVAMGNLKIDSLEFDSPQIDFIPTNYTGPNADFFRETSSNGAGNKALKPEWANGWTVGLD